MAQTVDSSLEQRLSDIESALRSLRTTNWTDLASVVNAAGAAVPLSSLAFGQVADTLNTDVTPVSFTGVSGTVGGTGFVSAGGPSVNVLVSGGRLRVDIAALMVSSGNKASLMMSYGIRGPAVSAATAPAAPVIGYNGDTVYSVECFHSGMGQEQDFSGGSFGLHTGLARGWYNVTARYSLSYSGTSYAPYGIVTFPRIVATPY